MQEMKQHIKQQIMEEMGLSNTAGQMTQQYQNTGIQSQNYQPNQNYQLPDTSNIITLEDPNFKGRIRYSDGSTLYQDARQLPINQKFYERTGRTEEPTEIHKLSARIAELEREKVRNRRQTNTCYNCGRTGHMQKECRQQRRNNATSCNYCKRTGHNENDCWTKQNRMKYNNNNAQRRNNDQNNTREVNYINYEDVNYVDYENYENDQEVYITTRSGKKYVNPTPKIATPRETTPGRRTQPMKIDREEIRIKRTLEPSKMEKMTPEVDITEIMNQTQANITIAQLLNNPIYRRELTAALRKHEYKELRAEESQNNH